MKLSCKRRCSDVILLQRDSVPGPLSYFTAGELAARWCLLGPVERVLPVSLAPESTGRSPLSPKPPAEAPINPLTARGSPFDSLHQSRSSVPSIRPTLQLLPDFAFTSSRSPRVAFLTLPTLSLPFFSYFSPSFPFNNPTLLTVSRYISAATMEVIRSVIKPITHNLPWPLPDLALDLLGPTCYTSLLLDVDFSSQQCLKLAVSKGLGVGIILASAIVKVPQIMKIVRSGSSEGLSFLSYCLEIIAYTIGLAYNIRSGNPFSTFGETVPIVLQNVIIGFMILSYSNREGKAFIFLGTVLAIAPALFIPDMVGMEVLSYLQAFAGVIGIAAKVPQIVTVFSEGTTGQLSAFAVSRPPNSYSPRTLY